MTASAAHQSASPASTGISALAAADQRELALLRATAAGDRAAFERLYADYHRRLSRFLRRFTARADAIDDVVNGTFWVVWQRAGAFRGDSRVSTWIMGIACRRMLELLRQQPPGAPPPDDDEAAQLLAPAADDDTRDWIAQGLRRLPAEQRLTLELAYYFGHSCDEIAAIMECPVGTVKARMFHARVRLRNLLPLLGGVATGGDRDRA